MPLPASEKSREELLEQDSKAIIERSEKIASQFYSLNENEDIKEITSDILNSDLTKEPIKQLIISTGRRFFLFRYPSDGFQVKGYISFVPDPSENPLLLFLRGGNRIFGLSHPASDISCAKHYTVIATIYRGGVSEGVDEYGGEEVNDVGNLMRYFPTLQQKLGISFHPSNTFMLGGSRGGMEMFLALGRDPELQSQIKKAASLSGLLDMNENIRSRDDMKQMYVDDFGLSLENQEEWIAKRNPIESVSRIRSDLPFLIIQGSEDIRVGLVEGYNMVKKLEENGNPVTYLEVPGGDHCLNNQPKRVDLIVDWFEG